MNLRSDLTETEKDEVWKISELGNGDWPWNVAEIHISLFFLPFSSSLLHCVWLWDGEGFTEGGGC